MSEHTFENSNVRVVPSKWPPPGKLPSEIKKEQEMMEDPAEAPLVEVIPTAPELRARPLPKSEAQELKSRILDNALREATQARESWTAFVEWAEITDPEFARFRDILNEMAAAINDVGYRQSIL